jgi:hypothetical protein
MHQSQANDEATGTTVFQVEDEALDYLDRLVGCEDIEFEPLALAFDPSGVLQKHLGGVA